MPAAARVGDLHACPASTGTVPHVGGAIMPPGAPTVLIGNQPAAGLGDQCVCTAPAPDVINGGSAKVTIGGKPAARMGDSCAHGGSITAGFAKVIIN